MKTRMPTPFENAQTEHTECSHCNEPVELTQVHYLGVWWAQANCKACGMIEEFELSPRNEAAIR